MTPSPFCRVSMAMNEADYIDLLPEGLSTAEGLRPWNDNAILPCLPQGVHRQHRAQKTNSYESSIITANFDILVTYVPRRMARILNDLQKQSYNLESKLLNIFLKNSSICLAITPKA
jgi:3-methyladenine DNA glycosylase AlkC